MPKTELVVALDTQDMQKALGLAKGLQDVVPWLKVGLELFTLCGPNIVKQLKDMGYKVFLDLKMYDIPNTVHGGVLSAAKIGADMLTIHLQGGERMAKAAVEASEQAQDLYGNKPTILGVSVLTSMSDGELPSYTGKIEQLISQLAQQAKSWGVHGVVSSGHEVKSIKQLCGKDFLCLTPGIRPQIDDSKSQVDDQRRVMTPSMAVEVGSNFIVVGRPITKADDPVAQARAILGLMQ